MTNRPDATADVSSDAEAEIEETFVRAPQQRGAVIGGPAAFPWRWLFPLVTIACLVAVPVLARIGAKAVLDTEGSASLAAQVRDPTAPGYRAFVTPSPTALVVVLDANDESVGAALLASAGDTGGGTAVVIGANVELPQDSGDPATLADAWSNGGSVEVGERTAELFGVVVDQIIEARPSDLAVAADEVAPLDLSFVDPLVSVDEDGGSETVFPRGVASLSASDMSVVFAALGPNEAEVNRIDRHVNLWREWISAAGTLDVEDDRSEPGLGWYVADIGRAGFSVRSLPVQTEGDVYVPDGEAVRELVQAAVPFPVLFRDDRPTVRVENGPANPALNRPAVETIAGAGGLVTVIGNPIDVVDDRTRITYFEESDAAIAGRIAAAFGGAPIELVDPSEAEDELLGGDFDIVVSLGTDYEPAVGE